MADIWVPVCVDDGACMDQTAKGCGKALYLMKIYTLHHLSYKHTYVYMRCLLVHGYLVRISHQNVQQDMVTVIHRVEHHDLYKYKHCRAHITLCAAGTCMQPWTHFPPTGLYLQRLLEPLILLDTFPGVDLVMCKMMIWA